MRQVKSQISQIEGRIATMQTRLQNMRQSGTSVEAVKAQGKKKIQVNLDGSLNSTVCGVVGIG